MIFELIATVVAGFGGAGIALLLNKVLGGRLPRWLTPVAAGLAMLAATIANEYGWYDRTAASLPEGFEIAATVENRAFFRPWAHVFPFVTRFLAIDTASMRTHDALPGQKMVEVYAFGRWTQPQRQRIMVDCTEGRRADITAQSGFESDGRIAGLVWRETGHDDPLVKTACGEG